jgi:hypothetical protein
MHFADNLFYQNVRVNKTRLRKTIKIIMELESTIKNSGCRRYHMFIGYKKHTV